METQTENPDDPLLAIAYWSTLALSVVALLLSLLYLAILMNAMSSGTALGSIGEAVFPFFMTGVTWAYLEVLSLEYWQKSEQRPLSWLIVLSLAGAVCLAVMFPSIVGVPHGGDLFLIPCAIGALAFICVLRCILRHPRFRSFWSKATGR